jgi:hypothetical protein
VKGGRGEVTTSRPLSFQVAFFVDFWRAPRNSLPDFNPELAVR